MVETCWNLLKSWSKIDDKIAAATVCAYSRKPLVLSCCNMAEGFKNPVDQKYGEDASLPRYASQELVSSMAKSGWSLWWTSYSDQYQVQDAKCCLCCNNTKFNTNHVFCSKCWRQQSCFNIKGSGNRNAHKSGESPSQGKSHASSAGHRQHEPRQDISLSSQSSTKHNI